VVGVVVSLLTPEPESEARYAEIEQRIHLGPQGETAQP
jgi:hypothetical protein